MRMKLKNKIKDTVIVLSAALLSLFSGNEIIIFGTWFFTLVFFVVAWL